MAKENKTSLVPKSERIEDLMNIELPASWGNSPKMKDALRYSLKAGAVKHGLFAAIPLVCRGADRCAFADTCALAMQNMEPEGERCPIEISHILSKFQAYTDQLEIDHNNVVDMTLIKDLIDLDVQIARADNKLASDGDFIQMITVTITEDGDEIQNPAIHKAVEYKNQLLKKRHDVLQLLHSTRKDKAGDKLTVQFDPSTYAANLMAEADRMRKNQSQIIDVTPKESKEGEE